MPKVYIIGGSLDYRAMFEGKGFEVVDEFDDADLIQFCGGADVDPTYYGEMQHFRTNISLFADERDEKSFIRAMENGTPCAGICRGGQFLNVMSGGRMYQHVDNHTSSHDLTDIGTGEQIRVTSTHHQMMRPSDEGKIVAIAKESTFRDSQPSRAVLTDVNLTFEDVEVVYYENTNSLCFQPHPEMVSNGHPCQEYYFSLIKEYLKLS